MKQIVNPHMALFAVGVMQPTSPVEVRGFLKAVFSDGGQPPTISEISEFLRKQRDEGRVLGLLPERPEFYSLTHSGNQYLSPRLRRSRDKFRMYLLRDAHGGRVVASREASDEELAGASPAVDTSTDVKGGAANKLVRTTFGRRFAYGQPYWPRIQRQFVSKTGPSRTSRDFFPNLLSFISEDQANDASHREFRYDYFGLGLCLGISPQLIWTIANASDRFYRSFTLPKKGGGERPIESPRVFLKVIQWFLADFVLDDLPVHESVHSFTMGRSIATNALQHQRRPFVGNADVENFFGTVRRESLVALLRRNGFDEKESEIISRLCTKQGRLPQGAPTSPPISNAILYDFDLAMSAYCVQRDLTYSRYADDITISGNERGAVLDGLEYAGELLSANHGLQLNQNKTRIAGRGWQQRVTGVVVNDEAAPPRMLRRKIRAAFHNAVRNQSISTEKFLELSGYIGYLKMFPKFENAEMLESYQTRLRLFRRSGSPNSPK